MNVSSRIQQITPGLVSFLIHAALLMIPPASSKREKTFIKVRINVKKEETILKEMPKEEKKLEVKPKEKKKPKKKKKPPSERKHEAKPKELPPPRAVQGLAKEVLSPQGALAVPLGNTLMVEDEGKRLKEVAALPENLDLSRDPELMASTVEIPKYTEDALDANIQGSVVVDVYVDEKGDVQQVELSKKVGYGMDQMIIDSAKKAKFKPRTDASGKKIPGWSEIKFLLEIP